MKLELQAELFRRHPRISRRAGDEIDSGFYTFDKYGVQCGDGWFELVDRLARAAEEEIGCLARRHVTRDQWPRVVQIKEKIGTLRFHLRGPRSGALRALIEALRDDSWRTCENCGRPSGLTAAEPWSLCTPCRSVREREHEDDLKLDDEEALNLKAETLAALHASHARLTALLAQRER